MRVFRVKGLLSRSQATMPLGRILDITVVNRCTGRLLGFGHFTFESAAQDQGLRDISYVGSVPTSATSDPARGPARRPARPAVPN